MNLNTLLEAYQQNKLLVLWGQSPVSLSVHSPPNRLAVIQQWAATMPESSLENHPFQWSQLPPLPILSLDPTAALEQHFKQAAVELHIVKNRHDVVTAAHRYNLIKLAGDLPSRAGLILSQAEINQLRQDATKRHLLTEARRIGENGVLLLLGGAPENTDFQTWWRVLAPMFENSTVLTLSHLNQATPANATRLDISFETLCATLWSVIDKAIAPPLDPRFQTQFAQVMSAFTPLSLTQCCYDHFPTVYHVLTSKTDQAEAVKHLFAHCVQNETLDHLLTISAAYP